MPNRTNHNQLLAKGWDQLSELLLNIKDSKDMQIMLKFLLSEEEAVQLSKRILLIQRILSGDQSQRDIAKELSMSLATITRCSNLLKKTPQSIKNKFRDLGSV